MEHRTETKISESNHKTQKENNNFKRVQGRKTTYDFQFRFIIPTTRPDGRDGTLFTSPSDPFTRFVARGASSALLGAK